MSHRNRADLEGVETSPDGRYIRFDEKLGSGAYKSVWLAYDTDLGIEVAWNTVDLKRLPEKEKIRLKSETDILKNLNHNCIINFYNSWENAELEQVIFTTEIVTSGTLKQYVSRFKPIKLRVIKKWCRQILQGLCYLHSKNPPIIHRDLKCDNIFINGSTGDIRIGDLGLSTMRNATHAASVLGTPEFMAPELYDEWYTEKVDVYAFGMVVLEMISNEYPYAECTNTAQIFKKVSQGIRPESLNRLQNSSTREFIELCLAKSNVRLAAEELAKHPFLDPRFVDYRERFPIPYDPIVTTTNSSTPLVPVMELAAVAEHSQHSLEHSTIHEDESEQAPESNEVNFLEVILENTSENIARVVLTLDLGSRRKEVKFPFDLDSDTAEAVAIEMVKELGLQQSSVNKLSDGIYAAIKDEKIKWNQTKMLLGQNRAVLDSYTATTQPSATSALNSNLVPAAITSANTAHHSVPMLGPTPSPSFPTQLTPSLKPQSVLPVINPSNPALTVNTSSHQNAGIVSVLTNQTGILSNVATDAPMIDPFTGTPLQPSAASHQESFAISEQASFTAQTQQQPFSPAPSTASYSSSVQFQGQSAQVSAVGFNSSTTTPTYASHTPLGNNSFPNPVAGALPKPPSSQSQKAPNVPALDSLLVNVASLPNLQAVANNGVAPPSSFANAYPPGPSPLISAGSFTQTSIPFVAQPPSSFQSATSTASVGAPSSFGNVSYPPNSSYPAPVPSLFPNATPAGTAQTSTGTIHGTNMQPVLLAPPASAAVSQASVSMSVAQAGISVPTSQASLTMPSSTSSLTVPTSQASVSVPSSSSPVSQAPSMPSSQVLPPPVNRSDSICELGRFDPFPSNSPTGVTQPAIAQASPAAPRFVKRRSVEDVQFPESNLSPNDTQGPNTAINADNSASSANPKASKSTPDQALDISNFLSGFDVAQLSPNQLTALRDLRSQLDESIRALKTQYASMYREAVNKYKMEVVDNLTGWGFPIPPINLKTQGLGSARGAQQGGAPKSVNHLSRRTRDVISLAHGSSNDLISLESSPGANNPGQASNSSLPAIPSQVTDQHPDHIYNRLIQPFAPAESNADSNNSSEMKSGSVNVGVASGPGPNWPPKIDPLDPSLWDPSSQSPS